MLFVAHCLHRVIVYSPLGAAQFDVDDNNNMLHLIYFIMRAKCIRFIELNTLKCVLFVAHISIVEALRYSPIFYSVVHNKRQWQRLLLAAHSLQSVLTNGKKSFKDAEIEKSE